LQNFDPTRHNSDDFRMFCTYSYELYQILIKPIEKYLVSDKIILVPDEILSYLPFDILINQLPEIQTANYRDLPYLIKKYTLSYSYSASLLMDDLLRSHERYNRKVLAVAPAYPYEKTDKSVPAVRQNYLEHLNPLPGAAEEVSLITTMLKGRKLTDSMATEKAFKKFAPEYGILHLAMHTLIDNQNPMYSKLVFNQWLSGPDEGLLNTYELYNMQLNARMVVLSACRSGDGILQKGEGIMSLARGFLYAGCPSLVMTLWNVEDKSGLEIMYQFYRQIKKGRTKNEALRRSKLTYLESAAPHKTHPYYWAGYLQIGEPSAIFVRSWGKLLMIIMVPVLLVFITKVFRKWMKKQAFNQLHHGPQDRT
jgi:CHAT domain-containing protein